MNLSKAAQIWIDYLKTHSKKNDASIMKQQTQHRDDEQ